MKPKPHPIDPGIDEIVKDIIADKKVSLKVPEKLFHPEKHIIAAQEGLRNDKPYRINGLVNTKAEQLDIKVSPTNVDRSLRFLDTLLKGLKARGHEIILSWRSTYVQLFQEVREEIKLREQTTKSKVHVGGFTPIGKLYFCAGIGCNRRWADGSDPIENKIALIIATLEYDAKRLIKGWEQQRIARELDEERRQRELEFKLLQEKELNNFKNLLRTAKREHEVQMIRAYIRNVESEALKKNSLTEELKMWIVWAHAKADWYDPHVQANDQLLRGADRDAID